MGGIEGRRVNLFMYDVIMMYIFVVSFEIWVMYVWCYFDGF